VSDPPRWRCEAWIPLIAGLYWLWSAPGHGVAGFAFSILPGTLLLGSGLAMLLMPGDLRVSQFAALGGGLGILTAPPAFLLVGFVHGATLVGLSVAALVAAGWYTLRLDPRRREVAPPPPGLRLAAEVAGDELILSVNTVAAMVQRDTDFGRIRREIEQAGELYESMGWMEKPTGYHVLPPGLESPAIRSGSTRGAAYEALSFESGYEPNEGEPGRERWLERVANRTAHAWVMRHRDGPRPWLVCIHGYQMGRPLYDFSAFPPGWLHRRLGLNLLLPVLPLHGPRTVGWRSGEGFLGADVLDTVHAEAQAIWDIRRMLGWVRAEGATDIGVYGLSLGGYNAVLLASLEEGLDRAIAGIPASDFARLFFRHRPTLEVRRAVHRGIDEARVADVLRVVSPLALAPRVPHERRFLFGAAADRIVPPEQVLDLWRHWERPRIEWYPGAHVSFGVHAGVRALVEEGLRAGSPVE
jgi:dienelactone hydrolase